MECLKYMHENGIQFTDESCYYACLSLEKSFDILKYVCENGAKITTNALSYVIHVKRKEHIEYLMSKIEITSDVLIDIGNHIYDMGKEYVFDTEGIHDIEFGFGFGHGNGGGDY